MSVYSATHRDVAERDAAPSRATAAARRRRKLTRRSDDLLERLETQNLAKFGALKTWSSLDDCRLTSTLVKAVNHLLIDVGLEARRLLTTREAVDGVYEAQSVIFGHRHDLEEDNTDER